MDGMTGGMEDETWTDFDDALVEFSMLPDDGPVMVAHTFWHAVREGNTSLLADLITPESRAGWGDFREARKAMHTDAAQMGLGTHARIPDEAPDVCHIAVYDAIETGGIYNKTPAAYLSLVHRPELGGWRVHGFGPAIPPHILPR